MSGRQAAAGMEFTMADPPWGTVYSSGDRLDCRVRPAASAACWRATRAYLALRKAPLPIENPHA